MRRCKGVLLAGMLVLSMSVPVYADKSVVVKVEAPADTTDYYMTVDSGGVGVDIYPSTDEKGEKLNDKTVKDGTVLHIEGRQRRMVRPGYTEYNGRYGYVLLEELRPSKDAELAKAGIAGSTEKETSGVKQGGASDTQNSSAGETQGEAAGMNNTGSSQSQNGEGQGTSAGTGQHRELSGFREARSRAAWRRADSTGSSQAQSGEVQGPPAAEGTTEGGDYAEEAVTKPVNGTAATSFKEENSWYKSPFIWIGIATALASNRNSGLSFEETLTDRPDQYKKNGEFCEEITACQEEIIAASSVCGSCGQPGSGHGSRCGRLQ